MPAKNSNRFVAAIKGAVNLFSGRDRAEAECSDSMDNRGRGGHYVRDDLVATVAPIAIKRPLSPRQREARLMTYLATYTAVSRHDLDSLVGAENSPDLIMRMRRKYGFDIKTERRVVIDRDGNKCRSGWYLLSPRDVPMAQTFAVFGADSLLFVKAKLQRDLAREASPNDRRIKH